MYFAVHLAHHLRHHAAPASEKMPRPRYDDYEWTLPDPEPIWLRRSAYGDEYQRRHETLHEPRPQTGFGAFMRTIAWGNDVASIVVLGYVAHAWPGDGGVVAAGLISVRLFYAAK